MEAENYWLRWQVFLCALTFTIPAAVSGVLIRRRHTGCSASSDLLWVPCWRNLHPFWLLLYRVFAFLSMAFLLYHTLLTFGFFVFFFYTQWTFALVMVYFALAIFVSARGCWSNSRMVVSQTGERAKFLKNDSHENFDESATSSKYKEARDSISSRVDHSRVSVNHKYAALSIWENLMLYAYQACAGAVMLTDIVFWCLLLPFMSGEHFKLTLLIGGMHSVNAVFLILDSALNNIEFPWFGLAYFVLWSCSYVVFQWGLHICCFTWWPYPFLELSTPWAPAWYMALALVHIPCYGLYVYLIRVKEYIFSRMFPEAYMRCCL